MQLSLIFQSIFPVKFLFFILIFASIVVKSIAHSESCRRSNVSYNLCSSSSKNLTVISSSFSETKFAAKCHEHFVKEILGKSCKIKKTSTERPAPTKAQRYGYGLLAVFIVSILSLAGLCVFPLLNRVYFQYVLEMFTALAVGTLFGDSMFHLIPLALGLHSHENNHNHSSWTVPDHQWKLLLVVLILYAFYLLEVFLHSFAHYRHSHNSVHLNAHGHSHTIPHHNHSHSYSELCDNTPIDNDLEHNHQPKSSEMREANGTLNKKHPTVPQRNTIKYTGYMVLIGDSIHNFADGLAIGAAFNQGLILATMTAVAVGCHELPHELGDYAILIQSGFSHYRALLWNFLSATTAIIGFFISTAVSTNENIRQWIFALTIGMFLYIALVDLLPTLLGDGQFEMKRFIFVNIGFLSGICLMFFLALYEHEFIQRSSKFLEK